MRPYHKLTSKRVKAFTLTEILVVLIIIGILVMLSLPIIIPMVTKSKTTEAKLQLTYLHTLEKSNFYEFSKYSKDLPGLGFIQDKLITEDQGKAYYRIEITEATNNSFTATATSVVDFDGDGIFNVWQIDQDKNLREITPD